MKRQTKGSVGWDITLKDEDFIIKPNEYKSTKLNLPVGNLDLRSRSGLASKGLMLVNYNQLTEEVFFFNFSSETFFFKKNDRLAQVVTNYLLPFPLIEFSKEKIVLFEKSSSEENVVLFKKKINIIDTGLKFKIPIKTEIEIATFFDNCFLINSPATIDTDYRDNIKLIIYNDNDKDILFNTSKVKFEFFPVENSKNILRKYKKSKVFLLEKKTVYENIDAHILEIIIGYNLKISSNNIVKIPIILKDIDYSSVKILRDVFILEKVFIINCPGEFDDKLFLIIKNFNSEDIVIKKNTHLCNLVKKKKIIPIFKKGKVIPLGRGSLGSTGLK